MKPDIHADDYAYSLNTSKDILECMKLGKLDSISLICNTSYFDECVDLLYKNIDKLPFMPLMSVHLNLVEGNFNDSLLPRSWSRLFIDSYIPSSIKDIIKKEIKIQIDMYLEVLNKCKQLCHKNNIAFNQKAIRIDSHTHTHLLPVVWKALIELVEENNYELEYIRNPKEPIKPFISSFFKYEKINYIKNIILNIYSKKVDRYCMKHNLKLMYMWGLIMSGKMDIDRINKHYDQILKISLDNNRELEILFHPGKALKDEYTEIMNKEYFNSFNNSDNRHIEKNAVLSVQK